MDTGAVRGEGGRIGMMKTKKRHEKKRGLEPFESGKIRTFFARYMMQRQDKTRGDY